MGRMNQRTQTILSQAAKVSRAAWFIEIFFGPDQTLATVSKLSDAEVFAFTLEFVMKSMSAAQGSVQKMSDYEIIGSVPECDNALQHFVVRRSLNQNDVPQRTDMDVVTMMRQGEDWFVIIPPELKEIPSELATLFAR